MAGERVAARYAKSLIDLGVEKNSLEDFHKDISLLKEALKNRDLYLLVKSPIIKAGKKIAIFKEIFGGQSSEAMMTFYNIVMKKGRETILPEVADAFMMQYQKLKHVTGVRLTTATPLNETALNEIKAALLKSTETDEAVEIETKVNPDLIGGFVIEMGDKLYDASVAYKLDQIKRNFTDNKYIKSY